MAWWQSPIFLVIAVVILVVLLIGYRVMRNRKRAPITPPKNTQTAGGPGPTSDPASLPGVVSNAAKDIMPDTASISTETQTSEEDLHAAVDLPTAVDLPAAVDRLDQIISPDINLIPDVILKPGEETVLLIMPELIPTEEVKKFENFLRKTEALKIVTTGGSSDEGSNIGIRILSPLNLTALLVDSNMSIVKHLRKKGERIVLSPKPQ
jgi:hypothetical protein